MDEPKIYLAKHINTSEDGTCNNVCKICLERRFGAE